MGSISVMARVRIEKIAYHGWTNCYRLTNGEVDVVVTADVGPRVMRYGFIEGQNLFYECTPQLGNTGEPWWMIRGGHRFWIAPETVPETYALDNAPVEVSIVSDASVSLRAAVEAETNLQKEMVVTLAADGGVQVIHRLTNRGSHTVEWAPWPATLLAPGGMAFAAFPERPVNGKALLPTHPLVMWTYTDLSDPRWKFTKRYLILQQDPGADAQQKAGLFNEETFAAYLLNGELFVKRASAQRGLPYTDFHSSFQIFTNRDFMELETLGPLTKLGPEESVSHTEHWSLRRGVAVREWSDEELDRVRALIS